MLFTESNYENAVLQLFTQTLGYSYAYGPDIEPKTTSETCDELLFILMEGAIFQCLTKKKCEIKK